MAKEAKPHFAREALLQSLRKSSARRIVLWGRGGIGKTTLLREYLAEPASLRFRLWDLEEIQTKEGLETVLLRQFFEWEEGRPLSDIARGVEIVAFDNADLCGEALRVFTDEILGHKPSVRVVVATKDRAAWAEDEVLAIPDLDRQASSDLFAAVAGEAVRSSETQLAVLDKLGGWPLGIVIAASHLRVLGPTSEPFLVDLATEESAEKDARVLSLSYESLTRVQEELLRVLCLSSIGYSADLLLRVLDENETLILRSIKDLVDRSLAVSRNDRLLVPSPMRALVLARWESRQREERHNVVARELLSMMEFAPSRAGAEIPNLRVLASSKDSNVARRAALLCHEVAMRTGPMGEDAARLLQVSLTTPNDPDLQLAYAETLVAMGRVDSARKIFEEFAPFPRHCLARSRIVQGRLERMAGDPKRAIETLKEALSATTEDSREAGSIWTELGAAWLAAGSIAKGRQAHASAVGIHRRASHALELSHALSHYAVATHRDGRMREALVLHREALQLFQYNKQTRAEASEFLHIGFVETELGEDESESALSLAVNKLEDVGASGLAVLARIFLARALLERGEFERVELLLEEASRFPEMAAWPRVEATRLWVVALFALERGDLFQAERSLESSLELFAGVVVGFEGLRHSLLAYLTRQRFGDAAASVAESDRCVGAWENRNIALAADVWLGRNVAKDVHDKASLVSWDYRFASRHAVLATKQTLRVDRTHLRVTLPDGVVVEFGRRKSLWQILLLLLAAHAKGDSSVVPLSDLVVVGWPGERMHPSSATKRVHTAIWTLRKLGFGPFLATRTEGYLLSPDSAWVDDV